MPDDLRAFAEYVDRIPSVAEHEASERAAHIYRHQAQAANERADAAEREYEALASFLMRVVWLVVGALVLLGVVVWAAAWAVG